MELLINDVDGNPAFRVSPLGKPETSLCFQLQYWKEEWTDKNGKTHEAGWRDTGKYPTSLHHSVEIILHMIERQHPAVVEFNLGDEVNLKRAARDIRKVFDSKARSMHKELGA